MAVHGQQVLERDVGLDVVHRAQGVAAASAQFLYSSFDFCFDVFDAAVYTRS